MQQFAAQSVRHIHHRRGLDTRLAQFGDDVSPRFGFQLSLQQVLFALEDRFADRPLSCLTALLSGYVPTRRGCSPPPDPLPKGVGELEEVAGVIR